MLEERACEFQAGIRIDFDEQRPIVGINHVVVYDGWGEKVRTSFVQGVGSGNKL